MQKIILKNNQEIELHNMAALSQNLTRIADYSELKNLENLLSDENLESVKYMSEDVVTGTYTNMTWNEKHFETINRGNYIDVIFGIREITEDEMVQKEAKTAAAYLTDEQAVTVKNLYPDWEELIGQTVDIGTRFNYSDILYKTIQDDLLIQEQYIPGQGTGALYVALEDEKHDGTQEDPIPVPETVTESGFEYEYGKYYIENDEIYLCKRFGVENPEEMYGQKEILYYPPSGLVGQYFEKVID